MGVGPGAHGFVDGVRYAVERSPMRYVTALQDQTVPLRQAQAGRPDLPSPAVVSHELVDPATAAIDAITLGLRLNAGIDETEMRERYGDGWSGVEAGLDWGVREGLLERNDRLRLTSRGRRLANEVFVRVLAPELV